MEVRWLFNNEATAHSSITDIKWRWWLKRSSRFLDNMFDSSQIEGWVTDPELSEAPMMATRSGAIAGGRLSWVFGGWGSRSTQWKVILINGISDSHPALWSKQHRSVFQTYKCPLAVSTQPRWGSPEEPWSQTIIWSLYFVVRRCPYHSNAFMLSNHMKEVQLEEWESTQMHRTFRKGCWKEKQPGWGSAEKNAFKNTLSKGASANDVKCLGRDF